MEKDKAPVTDDVPAAKRARVDDQEEGPVPGPSSAPQKDVEDDDDDDDGGEESDEDESSFPVTHEISLKDHTKVRISHQTQIVY